MIDKTKRMTFGAIMARGDYYPMIELIDGRHARIEGYGQDAATGRYWLQWAAVSGGAWNRVDDLDSSAELVIVTEVRDS